jgi:predicted nuclease with TOPRIM domain
LINVVKNWQIQKCSKKNEIKKLENELKYLEELSNTSTYKEDTSLKQKLEIIIKRLDKLYTEKTKGKQMDRRRRKQYSFFSRFHCYLVYYELLYFKYIFSVFHYLDLLIYIIFYNSQLLFPLSHFDQ